MLFVLASQEIGHGRTKEALHGTSLGRHHSHPDPSRAKRGRGFQADETGTHHDGITCDTRGLLDPLAVGPRSQSKHEGTVDTRHVQVDGLRSGCQKKCSKRQRAAIAQFHKVRRDVDLCHGTADEEGDVQVLVVVEAESTPPALCRPDSPWKDWGDRTAPNDRR
jgi:hypothetical protein